MQLKLRVGVGDTLCINVEPSDTFQNLSDRLYQLSGLKIDLGQLKTNDQPFDMTTNVIQYFSPKIEAEKQKLPKLCRLCSRAITHDPHYIFDRHTGISAADKINTCLPLHVTMRDKLPKQICTVCFKGLNTNYEFTKKVMAAQKSLENVFSIKTKNFPKGDCCPLCVVGRFCNIDNKNGVRPVESGIVQSCDLSLNQDASPLLSNPDTESSSKEYYLEDEVVTGYWDGGLQEVGSGSRLLTDLQQPSASSRKYRKRTRQDEDDSEWTIDEEYLPVSRRGRPKGTRNKKASSLSVEKSCALCGWLCPEVDMLNHCLTQHCQPDLAYFPCFLCKVNQDSESALEQHLSSLACLPPLMTFNYEK